MSKTRRFSLHLGLMMSGKWQVAAFFLILTMAKTASSAANRSQDGNELSPESLYDVYGDTVAALEACSSSNDTQEYNRMLLSFLSSSLSDSSTETLLKQMEEWEQRQPVLEGSFSAQKKKRQDLIVSYNKSLVQYATGLPRDAAAPLLDRLRPLITETTTVREDLIEVSSNAAFLVLDCILAVSEGRYDGIQQMDSTLTSDKIVAWLDNLDFESRPRLKFLLALYKSRLDFAARDDSGKMIDSKVKNVRKELKLRPDLTASTSAETGSVGSSSEVFPTEDSSIYSSQQQAAPADHQEALIQSLNQSALNLKADWEQLKGNTKKSLVLCAQARSSDPVYESIHANNLAVVYVSCGKRHLALHSTARSLRACHTPPVFRLDGTATPDSTLSVLYNSALLAFQAQKFKSSYECMANYVMSSQEYAQRPRCWLRMAECCIGIHNENKRREEQNLNQTEFAVVERNGESTGVLLNPSRSFTPLFAPLELVSNLGSEMDLQQVAEQPLGRAYRCLERVIGMNKENAVDKDCLESARCSLAFLKLEIRDFQGASDLAMSMLLEDDERYWQQVGGLRERLHKQRLACARLYASEAFTALGNTQSALQLISREHDSSFRNELSVDLSGGVAPNIDVNDVSKLIQSLALVQSNASSISACAGDLGEAERLALSALQTSEQDREGGASSHTSNARKALLFCMLQEGNREGALELLASAAR